MTDNRHVKWPRTAQDIMTEDVFGYAISTGTKDDCVCEIVRWVRNNEQGRYVVCANPHSLEVARTDGLFRDAIRAASLTVPDGIGIVIASTLLGGAIRERVTGSDIFLGVSSALNEAGGHSYFFLGSTAENIRKIREKMRSDYPRIRVTGAYAPPFSPEFSDDENRLMVDTINHAEPDVLWVGMTAPKQEKWIYRYRAELNVKFIGAVGAVFDFFTGNVKRPHPLFCKIGMEWLVRLLGEPRRLWRRNFVSNPAFLARATAQMMSREKTAVTALQGSGVSAADRDIQ